MKLIDHLIHIILGPNKHKEYKTRLRTVDIQQYDFPFENLVFRGGGFKCISFYGAVDVSTFLYDEYISYNLYFNHYDNKTLKFLFFQYHSRIVIITDRDSDSSYSLQD